MHHYSDEEEIIFGNFLILFLHVFRGLEYLHSKEIVHGDVKGSLYVHKYCTYLKIRTWLCHTTVAMVKLLGMQKT